MAKRIRGTFSPEQIQGELRQGDSPIVLMAKGEFIPGDAVVTDADGNAVDSGGPPLVVVGDPADGEVPTWDEDTGTWVPGEGGGGGGGGDGIPIQVNGDEIGSAGVVDGPVDSVFGRTGDVVAELGDYPPALLGTGTPDASTFLRGDGTWSALPDPPDAPVVVGFVVNDGTAGINIGPMLAAPRAGEFVRCFGVVKASDGASALTFVIKRAGVSVFSAPASVSAGVASGSTFTVALSSTPLAVALHDVFTIDITSGGSAWKFTAQLE